MKILIPIFRMKKLTEVRKGCPVSASGEEHLDVSTHFLNPRLKLFPPLHLSPRAFKHSSDWFIRASSLVSAEHSAADSSSLCGVFSYISSFQFSP